MKKEYLIVVAIAAISILGFYFFHVRSQNIEKAYAPKKKVMRDFKDGEIEVEYSKNKP